MATPSVSVVIPVYNRRNLIGGAIASVLTEKEVSLELIVVDDASTDGTADVVAAVDDPRIRLVRQDRNQGPSAARNRAIDLAEGEFVGFLDSDDRAMPGRFAAQVRRFRAEPDLVILGGNVEVIDADGMPSQSQVAALDDTEMRWIMLFNNPLNGSTAMVRADVLRRHGLRFDPGRRLAEDYEFWCKVMRHGRGEIAGDIWARYRVHDGQTSRLTDIVRLAAEISARNLEAIGVGADANVAGALRYIFNNLAQFRPADGDPAAEVKNWRWFGNFLKVFDAFKAQPGLDPASLARIEQQLKDRAYTLLKSQ